MKRAGLPSSWAPTMNSSDEPAAGTKDLTPLRRNPLGTRVALVLNEKASNSGRGSAMTTADWGTFSPAKSGR